MAMWAISGVSTMNQALTQTWGNDSQVETSKQTETPKEWVKQADWITGVQTMTKKAVAAIWNSEDSARTERNKAEKKWENVSVMA